jgi:hypothetical protein
MLKTTALEILFELPDNIIGQPPTLLCQRVLKLRPVFYYQSIQQRVLGLVSLIQKWAYGPEVVMKCIGWQGRASLDRSDKQPYPSTAIAVSGFTAGFRETPL